MLSVFPFQKRRKTDKTSVLLIYVDDCDFLIILLQFSSSETVVCATKLVWFLSPREQAESSYVGKGSA